MTIRSRLLGMLAVALLLGAGGGVAVPPLAAAADAPQAQSVWPKPPAAARIRYLRSVSSPADWGIAKSFFGRLLDVLTGSRDLHLVRPTGVAAREGVLYVADPGAQALFVFDGKRNGVGQVRRLGTDALVSPVAVALGPDDTIFLVDSSHRKVYWLDGEGQLRRLFAHQGLQRPAALAYDASAERLYVADSLAHQVLVYAPDGRLVQTIGRNGRGDGEFNAPTHLAVAGDGTLLVTDALNYRVQAFDRAGRFLWQLGRLGNGAGDFAAPKGVATDNAGHVLVVDALFDAVQIFRTDGALLLGFGAHGTDPGQFSLPGGLFIDAQDRVYVADAYNRRIQVFQRLGMSAEPHR